MTKDEFFMQRCFELAALGAGSVAPNPLVGSVIVHNEKIIGEGYHQKYGDPHAEVNAINAVKDKSLLSEATIYVNLEPCAHHGKTPPCTDLIVSHKLKRVVISNRDPFEQVDGKGIDRLKNAGIEVTTGVLEKKGRWLNRRFFTFHEKKRPYVILKFAQTIDGYLDSFRTEEDNEEPLKITSDQMNRLVHKWRSEESSILVGRNTVLLDNPSLTTRLWPGKNPLRLVIDPELQIKEDKKVMCDGNHTWIFNALKTDYCENNLCYIQINDASEFHTEILTYLYKSDIQSVIIEGGAATLSRFIEAKMWDEARIITGQIRIGVGISAPDIHGKLHSSELIGNELLQVYLSA